MTIDAIKAATGAAQSEKIFGFDPPVPHQCKFFDQVIQGIKDFNNHVNDAERDLNNVEGGEDALSSIYSAQSECYGLTDKVEDLRKAIEGVRDWGQAWKDLAKKFAELLPDEVLWDSLSGDLKGLEKAFTDMYEKV